MKLEVDLSSNKLIDIRSKQIMISTWCVECEEDEWATRIYNGNSLCEKHFKEAKLPTKGKEV